MGLNTLPVKVKTTVPDFNSKSKKIQELFKVFMKNTHEEISIMARDQLKASIQLKNAVATKTLLNSVYRRLLPSKSGDAFESNIGFQKPASAYAFFANYGRASGKNPPFTAIQSWLEAKSGGNVDDRLVWYVVHKIGEDGTKGSHFIEHAEPIIKKNQEAIVRKNIEQFKRTIK